MTADESKLLSLWVKWRAEFNKRVFDLPATDSLHIMVAAMFRPAALVEPEYAFDAADEETVKKLKTDYRTIAPLAKELPEP